VDGLSGHTFSRNSDGALPRSAAVTHVRAPRVAICNVIAPDSVGLCHRAFGLFIFQCIGFTETDMPGWKRAAVGLAHAFTHLAAAATCLAMVEVSDPRLLHLRLCRLASSLVLANAICVCLPRPFWAFARRMASWTLPAAQAFTRCTTRLHPTSAHQRLCLSSSIKQALASQAISFGSVQPRRFLCAMHDRVCVSRLS